MHWVQVINDNLVKGGQLAKGEEHGVEVDHLGENAQI